MGDLEKAVRLVIKAIAAFVLFYAILNGLLIFFL